MPPTDPREDQPAPAPSAAESARPSPGQGPPTERYAGSGAPSSSASGPGSSSGGPTRPNVGAGDLEGRVLVERLKQRLFGRELRDTLVGRYQLLGTIGSGGMGVVFTALDRELQRHVALKVVHDHLLDTPRYRTRMLREAQAMARLSHPNVVQVYEVGEHENRVFIAMELVTGRTMREWLEQERRGWRAVVDKYVAAGRGLAAAHRVGVIHRDFKPDNILVGDDGRVRVTDFGVAQLEPGVPGVEPAGSDGGLVGPVDDVTKSGAMVGTAVYMSPEQLAGKPLDARSDVFSYCIALYEALHGERPFKGESLVQLLLNVGNGCMRPAPTDTDVPPRIHAILVRGLAVDPEHRHPSVDALLAELCDELEVLLGHRLRGPGPSKARIAALREAGYVLEHVVREHVDAVWVRASERASGRAVVLELLRDEASSAAALARLRREHELLLRLDHPGVIRSEGLVAGMDGSALVLGDPGGVSLRSLVGSPLAHDPRCALRIGLSLLQVLRRVHAAGVVHGGIRPDALVVDPRTWRVVITDFQAAARGEGEHAEPVDPRSAAPEQLGAAAGVPDHRTDHHGLGATLYELLTGQPPDHEAPAGPDDAGSRRRAPVPPHTLQHGIPPVLSQIVLRLLDDEPDARYQSARGLRADLQRCLDALEATGHVPAFPLGTEDVSDRFELPEQLYGREPEQRRLWEAFERVAQGGSELVLVAGRSGIGKTTLVRALAEHLHDHDGRLITGKLDQVGSDVPYAALVQAFSELFERLAVESETVREHWCRRLHAALGDNLGIIAAMIPSLRALVGTVPAVQAMPPAEAANRFLDSFRTLLRALARPEHPLVVFLDDLQWCDASTLRLLGSLVAAEELPFLLWVGAYRDDEVDESHPLAATLRAIRGSAGARVHRIELGPLSLSSLAEMIAQTLGTSAERVATLAQLVHAKSEGNPFFARALLQSLHQQRLVCFDPALEQWSWDLGSIDTARVSDDVVDLMAATLVRLPAATQEVLRLGACIGNAFDVPAVAHAWGRPEPAVDEALAAAAVRGLVRRLDGTRHAFAHDRIQQVAYHGLDPSARTRAHLAIGRWLLAAPGAAEQQLFTLANHLQAGLPLVSSAEERARIARIQIAAGRRAKGSNAYAEAVRYFRQGLALLPADAWAGPLFDTCFELHAALMEVEYLDGNPERSAELFAPLMQHARSDEQRAEIYALRASLESSMGHHARAMDLAAQGLALLGLRMPTRGSRLRVLVELARVKRLLRGRAADRLDDLPVAVDPRMLLTMRLLIVYSTSGYFVDSTLLSVGMLLITRLTLRHGLTDTSAFGFAGFAMVLAGGLEQYQAAAEFGRLALRLHARFGNVAIEAKLEMINGMFLLPWVRPFPEVRAQLDRALATGLHIGDLAYASYSATTCATVHALEGVPLDETIAMTVERLPGVRKTLDQDMASIVVAVRRMSMCFRGETLAPPSFSSADWSEAEYVAGLSDRDTPLAMYYYRLAKLVTSYHFRCLSGVPRLLAEIHPRIDAAFGNPTRVDVYFYECLASALLYPQAGPLGRVRLARAMRKDLARLARWAASCSINYEARHLLARAEYERVVRHRDPLSLYTRAIQSARASGTAQVEGIGLELAAEFSASRGHDLAVRTYVDEACAAFGRWTATAKLRFLRERFASFTPALPAGPGLAP